MAVKLGFLTWKYRDRCFWSEPQVDTTGTAVFGPDILASFSVLEVSVWLQNPPVARLNYKKRGI